MSSHEHHQMLKTTTIPHMGMLVTMVITQYWCLPVHYLMRVCVGVSQSMVRQMVCCSSIVCTSPVASEAVISHPDEMENLEQYQVLANYYRKDSHQVNLNVGQVVHVIEKHDTG